MSNDDPSHAFYGDIPVSQGVSPRTLYIGLVGFVCIFLIGFTVVHFASYGHKWPAASTQRVQLDTPYN